MSKFFRFKIGKYEIRFKKWFVGISYKLPNSNIVDIAIAPGGVCKQEIPF